MNNIDKSKKITELVPLVIFLDLYFGILNNFRYICVLNYTKYKIMKHKCKINEKYFEKIDSHKKAY